MRKLIALITLFALTGCVYNKTVNNPVECPMRNVNSGIIQAIQIDEFTQPYEAET
jgi:hypothetical protein